MFYTEKLFCVRLLMNDTCQLNAFLNSAVQASVVLFRYTKSIRDAIMW